MNAGALLFAATLAAFYVTPAVLDADEAQFAACTLRMEALGLPAYAAGWEQKPPGILYLYEALFAGWTRSSLTIVHAGMAAAWVLTAVVVGRAATRLLGPSGFAPAVAVYALLRSYGGAKAGAANTEAFLSPFLAWGLLAVLAPTPRPVIRAMLGGAAMAVAILLKQPVALYGPAAVGAVLVVRGPRAAWTCAWAALVGAAVVLGAEFAHLASNGTLADAWVLNVEAPRVYADAAMPTSAATTLRGVARGIEDAKAAWLLAAVGAATAFLRPQRFGASRAVRRWASAIALLVVAGVAAASLGGHFFRHYWVMLHPVLATAAAAGWVALTAPHPRRWMRIGGVVLGATLVLVAWLPAQRVDKRRLRAELAQSRYAAPAFAEAAAAIRSHTGPEDRVFVWGANPELYLMAERVPASRHVSCYFLTGAIHDDVRTGTAPARPDTFPLAWKRLFEDFGRTPPALIVDGSGSGYRQWQLFPLRGYPALADFVERNYAVVGDVAGYRLYGRRSR